MSPLKTFKEHQINFLSSSCKYTDVIMSSWPSASALGLERSDWHPVKKWQLISKVTHHKACYQKTECFPHGCIDLGFTYIINISSSNKLQITFCQHNEDSDFTTPALAAYCPCNTDITVLLLLLFVNIGFDITHTFLTADIRSVKGFNEQGIENGSGSRLISVLHIRWFVSCCCKLNVHSR